MNNLKLITFQGQLIPQGTRLAGLAALVQILGLRAPVRLPSCISERYVKGGQRRQGPWRVFEKRYDRGAELVDHLDFALRHESIDLLVLRRAFERIPEAELARYIRAAPRGTTTRRAWFFYETLTGNMLDIEDAPHATAIPALDPRAYITGKGSLSRRHRIRDNLLGNGDWCPVVRRTEKLEALASLGLERRAREIIGQPGQQLVARAAGFLLLADSRASFEIEGEHPPQSRLQRWGKAVMQAGRRPLTLEEIIRLLLLVIEDTRFVFPGLRQDGVFLGGHDVDGVPLPEFIGARPQDLELLCNAMLAANGRMRDDQVDPVVQAAATAFGFVYLHPFQDGNGRVHRCLVHHILAERGYSPQGMIFPVSSVMKDRITDYRATLEAHSAPLMDCIDWRPTPDGNVEVTNDTADLYRYYDCTAAAEFLYSCVERTVEEDLPDEIDYLARHDRALSAIMERVALPDRLAQNLIRFIRQNDGHLSERKKENFFAELTPGEVQDLEAIVNDAFD